MSPAVVDPFPSDEACDGITLCIDYVVDDGSYQVLDQQIERIDRSIIDAKQLIDRGRDRDRRASPQVVDKLEACLIKRVKRAGRARSEGRLNRCCYPGLQQAPVTSK